MRLALRVVGIICIVASGIWWLVKSDYGPLYIFVTGLTALTGSFVVSKQIIWDETVEQRNRRVMLNHMEDFWIKGVLETSLQDTALLELGVEEKQAAVEHPQTVKQESVNQTLPAVRSMLRIFEEVGMGRSLLILGAPGSGKTTMLLELARQLLERARDRSVRPIPVIFNLASWTAELSFTNWLVEQLNLVYYMPRKTAQTWVNENQMFLLLDGLDEVERGSRAEDYAAIETKLSFEGAITLQPSAAGQIDAYVDHFGESLTGLRQVLKQDKVLQEMSTNPLMLSLMVPAYRYMQSDQLPALKGIEERHRHLFNTYIERMFECSTCNGDSPFTRQQILHSLSWLARKMIQHKKATYQIESMQPSWFDEQQQYGYGLCMSLIGALIGGLIGGRIGGLFSGLFVGLIGMLIGGVISDRTHKISAVDRVKWSLENAFKGLGIGVFFGFLLGVTGAGSEEPIGVEIDRLSNGLIGMVIGGALGVLPGGLASEQVEETTCPGRRLKQVLPDTLFFILIMGLLGGLFYGLIGPVFGMIRGLDFGLIVGLLGGLFFAFIGGLGATAPNVGLVDGFLPLIQHYILRSVLALDKSLPWRLMPFLDYAVELTFLRRVGGSYIFVHRLLMEHFAALDI